MLYILINLMFLTLTYSRLGIHPEVIAYNLNHLLYIF
jgi:hypothetical protein